LSSLEAVVMELRVDVIETTDDSYQAERELRNEVLLRPIGLPDYAWEMRDGESCHIVARQGEAVVGCVLLWPDGGGRGQLMQMAVAESLQGQGVGRLLVDAVLKKAKELKLESVYCHARSNVIAFYSKLGFVGVGERFEEVGLEHLMMVVELES
jgi:predicted GNAT family N-acyltransferase